MEKPKINSRIQWLDKDFLSGGYIKKIIPSYGNPIYIIKLDKKAPNEYAYNTDEVLSFGGDFEVIEDM